MKFRRKSTADEADDARGDEPTDGDRRGSRASRPSGPYDADDLPDDGVERVDLGSLLIAPEPGARAADPGRRGAQQVQAVLLAGHDGALELRAFSAPRNGDLWSEVRPQIAADMARRGGTATEQEGRFGPELVVPAAR